jgi:ribosomal protein S1
MINDFLPAKAQHTINTLTTDASKSIDLKVGQQIDAKISSINQQKTAIQLSIGNKRTDVVIHNETTASKLQAQQLQSGQNIKLVMTKLQPQAEYKILIPNQESKNSPTLKAAIQNTPKSTPANLQTPDNAKNPLLSKLSLDQKITATVLANDKNLTLKLFTPKAITLEFPKSSLAKATSNITLQVTKTGDQPQFKILAAPTKEESINNALKELLPKEQSSSVMLNQLVKNLATNESVPDALKRLAQDILRNLPSKQQLTEGAQLKKNIDNSSLFLEAKLADGKQTADLTPDLKTKITQLINALQQEPATSSKNSSLQELQTKSEGALQCQ